MTRPTSLVLSLALVLAGSSADAADLQTTSAAANCGAPPGLTAIELAEPRSVARIEQRKPLTIVAVGSSSTQGIGASAPDLSYPSRLAAELKERFPAVDIQVINRGKGGEDVSEELARLDSDVLAAHPELVIWQVGTNAVLRRDDLTADRELIERGVAQLKASGSDVLLMDMQYAPRVLARPAYAEMEQLIAKAAQRAGVGLFRRFEIMRYWQARQQTDAPQMVGPDGLHMTDSSYGCLAVELAEALARNWRMQEHAPPPPAARVAGLAGPGHAAAPPAAAAR